MLDLKGMLPEEDIQKLIALIVDRGWHGENSAWDRKMCIIR